MCSSSGPVPGGLSTSLPLPLLTFGKRESYQLSDSSVGAGKIRIVRYAQARRAYQRPIGIDPMSISMRSFSCPLNVSVYWLVGSGIIGSFGNCSLRHCGSQLYDAASRAILQIRLREAPLCPAALLSQAMWGSKLEPKLPGFPTLQCSAAWDVDL